MVFFQGCSNPETSLKTARRAATMPFFRRYHLRQSNDGTLGHADDRRVFLRPHPVGDCGGTAKTYAQMEKKVQDYGAEIERMEAMSAMEARLNKPTSSPITEKPMNGKSTADEKPKTGRGSDAYHTGMLTAL